MVLSSFYTYLSDTASITALVDAKAIYRVNQPASHHNSYRTRTYLGRRTAIPERLTTVQVSILHHEVQQRSIAIERSVRMSRVHPRVRHKNCPATEQTYSLLHRSQHQEDHDVLMKYNKSEKLTNAHEIGNPLRFIVR